MHACGHVCVSVCVCVCLCACRYTCMFLCMYVYGLAVRKAGMCEYDTYTYTCTRTLTRARAHTHIHTYTDVCHMRCFAETFSIQYVSDIHMCMSHHHINVCTCRIIIYNMCKTYRSHVRGTSEAYVQVNTHTHAHTRYLRTHIHMCMHELRPRRRRTHERRLQRRRR